MRAHLVVFAAAIVLPILAFAGFASWQYADGERSRLEQAALEEARDVAQAVDDELGNLLSSAQILALTSAVRNGHLEEFHRLAQDMQQALSIIAVLRKPDGQQVASPLAPFGTSLPRNQLPTDQAVLSSKQPQVTDLYTGAVSRVPLFSVTVPVIQAGDIVYLLNLSFPVERLRSIILREQPPEDWTVAVVDRSGTIMARNNRHEDFVGKPATRDLQENTKGRLGSWNGFTADGRAVFGAYARTNLSDWRVAVGVQRGDLATPLQRSLWWFTGLGVGLLAVSAVLASLFGQRITAPIEALTGKAAALGRGEAVLPVATTVSEVKQVGEALTAASINLRGRETDLRESEQRLREESHTLETLNRMGATVASELDLERVVQMVTDAGVELTGAKFGAFFYNTVNETGESLMLYTLSGVDRSEFERYPHPRATAVFAPTFKGQGVVRSDDILADPRYGKNEPYRGMPEGHLPVRSYLAVPVASRSGEVIGGLFFGHPEPGCFNERHEQLIVGIAGQAAIAIDNARLYRDAQRELEQRRQAEESLRDLNTTLEQRITEAVAERNMVWRTSQDLFVICGFDGFYRSLNPAWAHALGYAPDELIGTRFDALVHPDDVPATRREFERLVVGSIIRDFDLRLRSKEGAYRWYSWTCVPQGDVFYAAGRDMTERKQLEAQLRQSQKMEVVGQLTGGIAHDFNNLLTVVTGNLDMLHRKVGTSGDHRLIRNVENALEGARRAAQLTHRLLAFSRQSPLQPETVDINKLVGGMSDLLQRTLGENISIETVMAGGLWRTEADPNQLENAILNLAVNARDAMPEGGKLTIETANAHLDEAYAASTNGEVKVGQYVMVSVSDTGAGMTPDVRAKVFEPFFTTKPVGKGTGLGLAQVYGFTKQSGGHVAIYSEVGHGTTVKLYFPRLARVQDRVQVLQGDPQAAVPALGAGEMILVVEDEAMVRDFSVSALEDASYRVLTAGDGPTALRLLEQHQSDIALLFTDVVLAGPMNGRRIADEALKVRPDLKVLFTTGYTRNAIVHHGRLDEGVELITKPFTALALAKRVRDLLDGPQGGLGS
ncbi:GAF domain-containing protein [Microvirga aerilata]|uniref:histidine kinase n=1 Tax=Microvirga aerilata TaxID=670292 RepID=A0A936ZGU7_9HYPH|nr:ATP-binding protein [Microvirga aerilata]MBL0407500.1 GAF domain-containing protein [Microvirga aerilata]